MSESAHCVISEGACLCCVPPPTTALFSVFADVPRQLSFPEEETKTLKFWDDIQAFETSLKLAEGRPLYNFYDGPPFATGLPHYGHLLAGSIKDIVTRYWHQQGRYVERRFGWDCHGLPVEYEIDKTLGIKGKADVLAMGIDKYNAKCREIVMRYSKEWEVTVKRMGRWIDFKNDYKTLDPTFMESVWWVFSELFKKDLVYQGFKVMPFSTACNTPLSNFEAGQNYKDTTDPAVIVSFPLTSEPDVSVLAWTTTPWTLPSNLALCVHPEFEYVKIQDTASNHKYILLEKRLSALYKNPEEDQKEFTILEKFSGASLVGKTYIPLFNYFVERTKGQAFRIVSDTYVTDESGTGVVHQAPAFGEDDFRVCLHWKIFKRDDKIVCPVDESGRFTDEVPDFAGKYVKDADKEIIKWLKAQGRMIHAGQLQHTYPFCWRSDTPLIYKAVPSWFVRVESLVEKLLINNKQSYWVPENIQENRFGNWLRDARDWAISRNRYWGTPIPLWISEDGEEIVCVESIQHLEELTGTKVNDLHRENIDNLTIPSRKGKGVLRRVEEVFDCWFESGSMPYAQQHYPFENRQKFESSFPADFIAEGLDQTRGWFYTLLVISTGLFDKPAFKNLIVNGLVLAADGKKMSKRLKNYPDPQDILNKYGADALRLYMINSPVVRAEPLRFKEEGVKAVIKDVFLPWYNSYRFLIQNVQALEAQTNVKFSYDEHAAIETTNTMDKWVLASTQSLIKFVKKEMEAYRLYTVVPRLVQFVEDLTNWYIRLNRQRLKGFGGREDCLKAVNTLFEVLVTLCRVMAPFTPFLTELMYQNLRRVLPDVPENVSVHFTLFPEPKESYYNDAIERSVAIMQRVIVLGRVSRERRELPIKTPLKEVICIHPDPQAAQDILANEAYIAQELNVRLVTYSSDESKFGVQLKADPNLPVLGKRLGKDMAKVTQTVRALTAQQINKLLADGSMEIAGHVISSSDIIVKKQVEGSASSVFECGVDGDLLVILDCTNETHLVQEGLAREFVNRIQRMRKKSTLKPSDEVVVVYELLEDVNEQLTEMFKAQTEFLATNLKGMTVTTAANLSSKYLTATPISSRDEEIKGCTLKITLYWA